MSRPAHRLVYSTAVVIASVAVALAMMLILNPVADMAQSPFLLFFGAVVVSAWAGGVRAGLFTSLLSAVISSYFFIEPLYSFSLGWDNVIRTLIFMVECCAISFLCGSLRLTNQRLDTSLIKLKASEKSLQAAHQHITEILDAVTDGFYTLNQQWQFTYVNRQAEHILQRSRDELLGRSIWQLFPALVGTPFEETCHRVVTQQNTLFIEIADPLNPNHWYEIHINPLHNGLAVYLQEVTERKLTAVALSQSEARFRRIFECNMVAMGVWTPDGAILQANEQLLNLIGYARQDLATGHISWKSLTPPEWQWADEQALAEIAEQGVCRPFEKEYIHKQGHRVPVLLGGATFANGLESGVFFAIDLTGQKRTEDELLRLTREQEQLLQELAAERAQFEAVLRQMPEGVIIADAETGNITLANEQSNRILRHHHSLNLPLEDYNANVPFQAYDTARQQYETEAYPLQRSLRNGEVVQNEEIQICFEDGSCIYIDTNSAPIYDAEGTIISAVIVFQDITQRKKIETALRQSEERLQVALKNAPIAVFTQDRELRYTWIENPNLGFEGNQVIGKTDSDLIPAEEANILTQIKQQVLETGNGTREEVKITQNNQNFYYDLTVEPLVDDTHHVVGVTCAAIDISELKQTELALRESEARFRLLAERVHIIPWESDPITGAFTYVGPQAVEILGYPQEEWYSEHFWLDRIYLPDREWVPKFFQDTATLLDNYDFEYRMLAADGRVVWLYEVVNVVRDATGPKLLRGIMIDITRRKRQEQAQKYLADIGKVLASSLDYQTTLDQLARYLVPHLADWCTVHIVHDDGSVQPVATAHIDPEKVKWADALREKYPINPNDARGTARVLRTGASEFFPNIPDAVLVESARDEEHLRLLREVGFSSAMVVPMQAHGKILGTITLVSAESGRAYDQADLMLAEDLARQAALAVDNAQLFQKAQHEQAKAEAANRIKDEFLAVLSHELRTPLNPILGWSNLLRSGRLDATKTAYAIETIERNARLQTQLIEDLLDVSRILRGKLSLNMTPVDLTFVLEAALETVKLAAEAKSIHLKQVLIQPQHDGDRSPAATPPLTILGDAARLQQVFWNLLTNAVKFTPEGGRVEVKLESYEFSDLNSELSNPTQNSKLKTQHLKSVVQITVSDTGKGISADFLPHVFDYFRQADSATTRKFGGLGLGLAIVRHLVELHGGTIQADSPGEGMGATFTVQFPLLRASKTEHQDAGSSTADAPHLLPLAQTQILLVDDDTDTRSLLAFTLEQAGAAVVETSSASEAIHALDQMPFDVIVSDIGMPDMDGYQLIRHIRARPIDLGGLIPAIALTAYAGDLNQQQALAAGFQTHVSKPVDPAEFVAIVARVSDQNGGD